MMRATGQGPVELLPAGVELRRDQQAEAVEMSGLTLEELRGKSFVKILANRRSA